MSKTVQEILDKVKESLDLVDAEAYGERSLDPMISEQYLIDKFNEALEEIEYYIMSEYEDYFLSFDTQAIVANQSEYSLPSNINLNKIRRVVYSRDENHIASNNEIYKMNRLMNIDDVYYSQNGDDYAYMLIDRPITGGSGYETKMYLTPTPTSDTGYITTWYIRKMASVTALTDIVDVPFTRFLEEDIKVKVLEKDIGNPIAPVIMGKREELLKLMQKSIAKKIPDDQAGRMRMNNDFYNDSVL